MLEDSTSYYMRPYRILYPKT